MSLLRITTTRFGDLKVDEGSILTFTQPIIGFQEFRRFVLVPGPEEGAVTWLQSIEESDLAFILMDPRSVYPDYRVELGNHELSELAVTSVDELDVYTLVVVPADPSKVRTNLKAPILINPKVRLGKQTILEKSNYPVQFFLAQAKQGKPESKEVSNARTNA